MTDLEYRPGKLMNGTPINVAMSEVVGTLRLNEPILVSLEPGDATRYTLLLVPIRRGDHVSPHLGWIGIPEESADNYLFVSNLSADGCPGTWVPYGPGINVGTYDVSDLSRNEWSQRLISWWLTNLCEVA